MEYFKILHNLFCRQLFLNSLSFVCINSLLNVLEYLFFDLLFAVKLLPNSSDSIDFILHLYVLSLNLKQINHKLIDDLNVSPHNLLNFKFKHIDNLLKLSEL